MSFSFRRTYEAVVHDQVAAMMAAAQELQGRKRAWDHIASIAEDHFKIAEAAAKAKNWFDNLYVSRSDQLRVVQMHMGNHPVASAPNGSLFVEHGATVVISQNHQGSVIILLYPYESAVQRMNMPYLVWKLTDHPMTIKRSTITRLIADFMTYARVSSALFAPSDSDRKKIARLEHRSLVLQKKLPAFYLG